MGDGDMVIAVTASVSGYEQSFHTTIRGVTQRNADGADRQALLKALRPGEQLRLVREPRNPYDKYAVGVFKASGEQLGYVPAGDKRLADHIDRGGPVSATVV
jgi:hypothetical protein